MNLLNSNRISLALPVLFLSWCPHSSASYLNSLDKLKYPRYNISVDKLISYAQGFVGTPYKWAGNSPLEGFDCSGFVQEVLASAGAHPPHDMSAQELFGFYAKHGKPISKGRARPGSLVFYGYDINSIVHVDLALDPYRVIGAIGGNMAVKTRSQAEAKSAFVKVRAINYRKDVVAVIQPNFSSIGLMY